MKKILTLLFTLCALQVKAAYLGAIPTTNSMHATTNYLPIVAGSHTAQLEWLISPSNLVAVQNTVILPRTNLSTTVFNESMTLAAGKKFSAPFIPTNCQVTIQIANGGSAIIEGQYGLVRIPNSFVPTGWAIYAEPSGSITLDVWQDTFANIPPTIADTMTGSDKPSLTTANSASDSSIAWNNATNGYWWKWSVEAGVATVTNVYVAIHGYAQ